MRNTGIEATARAIWAQAPAGGFNWSTDFNISRNRNEVTALLNDEPIMAGFASRVEVGQPLGAFYGYVMDGIFQSQEEVDAHAFQTAGTRAGDVRFMDLNGDGVINADDRAIIGTPWPDFEGGLTNNFAFRGVDLSAFLQFSYGNDIYNGIRTYADQFGSFWDNHTTRALDRWTPDNPSNTEPRAVWGDPNSNTRTSSRFIEDGSYMRLKNVVLGYSLPAEMAQRTGFRRVRAYVQGQNLITWTNYTGFDPEVNYAGNTSVTRGTDFYTLPQARTVTFGFNLGI
jgi:TonB-dependent starch-binding outer membrane protein SusC